MAQDAEHEAAAAMAQVRKSRARQRWKEAALKETQRIRVEKLREKQAQNAECAERKQALCVQIEQELHQELSSHSWEAVLAHFGCQTYKQALVQFHPDRAPPGASFEEVVRREVVFKYVQMRHDNAEVAGAGAGSMPRMVSASPRRAASKTASATSLSKPSAFRPVPGGLR